MKKLMLAFCLIGGGLVAGYAQDTTSTDQTQTQQQYPTMQNDQEQDRERINSRDLPDAIKRSLEGQEYRGWLINAAYKTTGVSATGDQGVQTDTTSVSGNTGAYGQEIYVVELKNGAQTKTVRFDKDGNPMDDQGNDQK